MITRKLRMLWPAYQYRPLHKRLLFCCGHQPTMDSQNSKDTPDMEDSKKRYEECIMRLNAMQTPREEIERLRREDKLIERLNREDIVPTMLRYFERCGITKLDLSNADTLSRGAIQRHYPDDKIITWLNRGDVATVMLRYFERCGMKDDISQLPVIHITGSKGKGSVCAFCESILRKYNLKTGLLTSPHLIEVRERIRLNGKAIAYNKFSNYFTKVIDRLEDTKADFNGDMPLYNRVHTLVAFYTFIKEKVDVAVIEVGCGGQYDSTNFVPAPTVTGITSLALEHLKVLGGSLESIAWHKAGILKPSRPAFTVAQPVNGMEVFVKRAEEIGTTIQCVPKLEDSFPENQSISLGLAGGHQHINASLAVQLCRTFLLERKLVTSFSSIVSTSAPSPTKRPKPNSQPEQIDSTNASDLGMTSADPFVLPEEFITGLRDCYWPGRTQAIVRDRVTYYLDCAHTITSVGHCMEWFTEATRREDKAIKGRTAKILVFNMKPYKYSPSFLKPLVEGDFDAAIFCPSILDDTGNPADLTRVASSNEECRIKSQSIKELFEVQQRSQMPLPSGPDNSNTNNSTLENSTEEHGSSGTNSYVKGHSDQEQKQPFKCYWLPSIRSALYCATAGKDDDLTPIQSNGIPVIEAVKSADRVQVLITGSIYLVGPAMKLLAPELASG